MARSGRNDRDLLRVQETLNKAVVIGGSNSVEGAAGLRQLAQGLASSRLQGDELRSVLENLVGVTDALVTGLNRTGAVGHVTRGRLRELAAEGKLTAVVLIDALLAAGDDVDAQFDDLNATLGESVQQLGDAAATWVGETALMTGASAELSSSILGLADNFEHVANTAVVVAAAVAKSMTQFLQLAQNRVAASVADRAAAIAQARAAEQAATSARAVAAGDIAVTEAAARRAQAELLSATRYGESIARQTRLAARAVEATRILEAARAAEAAATRARSSPATGNGSHTEYMTVPAYTLVPLPRR